MLMEFVGESPISIDGKPTIKDLRVNFPKGRNAMRLKMLYIDKGRQTPIDINIYSYSNIHFESMTSLAVDIDGKELKNNVPFQIKLSIDLIHRTWTMTGHVKGRYICSSLSNLWDFIPEILKLI